MSANRLTKPSATMNRKADLRLAFDISHLRYRTGSGSDRIQLSTETKRRPTSPSLPLGFGNGLNLFQSRSPPLTDSPGPAAIRQPHSGQPSAKLDRESIVELPLREMPRACLW